MKKKKIIIPVVGILLIVGSIAGISFAYWKYSSTQNILNVIGTECLNLELIEENESIVLEKSYPISNEEGLNLKPYLFTVKNTCNTLIDYSVHLDSLESEAYLNNKYISVSIDDKEVKLLSNFKEAELYNEDEEMKSVESHILLTGFLDKKESKTHSLRLWIDEDADTGAMEKTFLSKVVIVGTPNEVYASLPNVHVTNLDANKEVITDFDATNHYVFSSEASILCEGEKSSCFIKFGDFVDLRGEILQSCGNDDLPGECVDLNMDETLNVDTWYRTKKNVKLKPNEMQTKPITFETLVCVGNDCSEKENYTLLLQDQIVPNITIHSIQSTYTGATINMEVLENESGLQTVTCKYGLNEENLDKNGVLSDNTCVMNDFTSNTTYYYAVEATDKVGNVSKKTGTITTDEIITAPTIVGGSIDFASSRTIRLETEGTADTGVKFYEYYISETNEIPSTETLATGTTMNEVTIDTEGTHYVFYRTISNDLNKSSWSGSQEVNIYYKASSIPYTNSDDATIQNVQQAIDAIRTKWEGENS